MENNKLKYSKIAISVWFLLQIPRFIALPLISDVLNGIDSPAWLYPAILDVMVATASPFLIYLIWKRRSHTTWVFVVIYLVTSIIDHGGSLSADFLTATPQVFGGEEGTSPIVASGSQAVIDIIVLITITRSKFRNHYYNLK